MRFGNIRANRTGFFKSFNRGGVLVGFKLCQTLIKQSVSILRVNAADKSNRQKK